MNEEKNIPSEGSAPAPSTQKNQDTKLKKQDLCQIAAVQHYGKLKNKGVGISVLSGLVLVLSIFLLFSPEWRSVGTAGLGSGILPLFLGLALSNYGTAKRQECLAKLSDEATEYLWHTSSATFGEAVDVEILLKNVKNSENPDYMGKGKWL